MQRSYQISSSYPIPKGARSKTAKYPWSLLKVGQSFLVKKPPKRIDHQCYVAGKRLKCKFIYRATSTGARIWRFS